MSSLTEPGGDQLTHIWSHQPRNMRITLIERSMAVGRHVQAGEIEMETLRSNPSVMVATDCASELPKGRMLPWMVTLPDHVLQWMMIVLYLSCMFAITEFHPREAVSSWRVRPNLLQTHNSTTLTFITKDQTGVASQYVKYRGFEMSHRMAEVIGTRAASNLRSMFDIFYYDVPVEAEVTIKSRCDLWEDGVAYKGLVHKESQVSKAGACYAACMKEKECRYFTYEAKSGTCVQLVDLTGIALSPGMASGSTRDASQWPGCALLDHGYTVNFTSKKHGEYKPEVTNSGNCSLTCLQEPRCLLWTFTSQCLLSYELTEPVPLPGAVSGHRVCNDRGSLPDLWPVIARRSLRLTGLLVALLTSQNAGVICNEYLVSLRFPFLLLRDEIPADHRHEWALYPLSPSLTVVQQHHSAKASLAQIIWRLALVFILVVVGFPALYIAGRRTNWTWSRLPLGFVPSVLQAVAAAADVDPTSVFNRALNPTRMNVWRLMVRAEGLLLFWALFSYARMFSDSIKADKKIHRSTLIMVFLSGTYIALVFQAYLFINQQDPTSIVDETKTLMLTFIVTWVFSGLCLWTCIASFYNLQSHLSQLAYSECWLQSQCFRFVIMVMTVSFFANVLLRFAINFLTGVELYSGGERFVPALPLQWVTLNRWSGGMILRETGFRSDVFGSIVNTMVAIISLIAFLPRSPTEAIFTEDEEPEEPVFFSARRFPPCTTTREVMKMRFLTHCCRVINKLERLKQSSGCMDEFAQEPFDGEEDIREIFSSLQVLGNPIVHKGSDVHAAVLVGRFRGRRVAVVTFRGTKGLKNLKADLKANMDDFEDPEGDRWYRDLRELSTTPAVKRYILGVRVHQGFQDSLALVKDELIERLRPLASDGDAVDIWCVGHSFGGALATLLAVKVHRLLSVVDPNRERTSLNVFCLGSPRIGNLAFRRYFNELGIGCVQMALDHDPITALPPALFGYRRVGRLALLSSDGHIRSDPGFLEMNMRNNIMAIGAVFVVPLAAAGLAGWMDSHKLVKYMAALQSGYEKESACQAAAAVGGEVDPTKSRPAMVMLGRTEDDLEDIDMVNVSTSFAGGAARGGRRWVLDEPTFGHPRGLEVELPEGAVVCGHRALAPMFGAEAVLLRRLGK